MTEEPKSPLPPELRDEIAAIAEERGCELLHVEFKGGSLRLILDRVEGGVEIADCEAVSRQASAILDLADFGRGRYTLEVTSPGLDRELYGPRDYERFQGSLARVTFDDPDDGAKRTLVGRLSAYQPENGGVIRLSDPDRDEVTTIPLAAIRVARLEIEL